MIGQKPITERIDSWISKNEVPHFIIFIGSKGSGKSVLTKYLAEKFGAVYALSDIKVDAIREVIDTAYNAQDKVVYHIKDADTMRAEAKNAMLKITEEPPKNAYFVMSVQSDASLLDTIKSRAQVLNLCAYSKDDIMLYGKKYTQSELLQTAVDVADTPYQLDLIMKYGKDFLDYVQLVFESIGEVVSANAFKSGKNLAFKDEPDKYDIALFFKMFIKLAEDKIYKEGQYENIWADVIIVTNKYLDKVSKLGVNKQQLYDSWVFEIREVMIDGE